MYRSRRRPSHPQPKAAVKRATRTTIAEQVFDGLVALDGSGALPQGWGLDWPGDDALFVTVAGVRYRVQVHDMRPTQPPDPNPTFELAEAASVARGEGGRWTLSAYRGMNANVVSIRHTLTTWTARSPSMN